MKNVLFLMLCVLFYSCNETKQKVVKDPALKAAIVLSTKSSVKETKLFAGFRFGMNKTQVDSVIESLADKNMLCLTEYIDEDAAPIEQYDIFNSSYELYIDDVHKMYLSFFPQYLNNHLSEMFYSIKLAKEDKDKYKEKPYVMLAHFFEKSERGCKFVKEADEIKDSKDSIFFYYKDNLIVSFQPSVSGEGEMIYSNGPEQEELYKKQDQSKDF